MDVKDFEDVRVALDVLGAQITVLQIAFVRSLGEGERMNLRELCHGMVAASLDSADPTQRTLGEAWGILGDALDDYDTP